MIKTTKLYFSILGLTGIFQALKAKLTKSSILLKAYNPDCKFPINLRIPSSDFPTYIQVFINKEYDFSVEKQPEVIMDAGANIGLASIYFTNKYPGSKIIAIEPERNNFELLKKNVAPYKNIIPIQAALWDKNEDIDLIDPGLGNWGFMTKDNEIENISTKFPPAIISHKVKGCTIDKLMTDYKLNNIDILKIDIEGAEREVFRETSSWINKVNALIVELHEGMKPGCLRSFYNGSNGFDTEWRQGENVYLSKGKYLSKHRS